MNEKTLYILAGVSILAGIFLLLVTNEVKEIPLYQIKEIKHLEENTEIKLQGEIKEISQKESQAFLNIKDRSGEIKVIVWTSTKLNLKKLDKVEVIGIIEKYQENLQIVADEIILLE